MSRQAYEYHPVRCTDVHSFRLTITHDCADPDACEWSAVGKGVLAEPVERIARIADALTSRLVEVEAERDRLAAKLGDVESLAAEFAPQGKPAPQLSGWDVSRRIRAILRDQP